jgi:hypothetical protein
MDRIVPNVRIPVPCNSIKSCKTRSFHAKLTGGAILHKCPSGPETAIWEITFLM